MQCPGQDNRYWDGDAVFESPCPHCGNPLEFFKDDSQRSCRQCGKRVLNPRIDFGCAAYCSHAEQCLGSMPPELLAKQSSLLKDKVSIAVRKHLLDREDLYKLAGERAEYAEKICREKQHDDLAAIITAILLWDCENPMELLAGLTSDTNLLNRVERLLNSMTPESEKERISGDILSRSIKKFTV